MRASIQSRTRSRTPVSIGSIQSSKSRASGCPVGCTECDLLIRSVMAWSPTGPERSIARIPLCGLQHPETTPPSKVYHLPDGTASEVPVAKDPPLCKLAVSGSDLPKRIGLDWSFDGCWSLAGIIYEDDPW